MKRVLHFSLLLIVVGLSATCSRPVAPESGSDHRNVTDDLKRTVRIPLKIDRAISLAPSLTEMIFAVGAGNKLVGVTTYCNFPEEAKAIQKVGDTMTPNIENIIALKPQVVFVSTDSQLEAFMGVLDQQGIAVFVTNPKELDAVYQNLSKFGELFGTEIRANEIVADLRSRSTKINVRVKPTRPVKVFVQISNDPLFTIGTASFLTQVVELAGGVSVTKDVPTAYPKLSKETALALDPEAIILSDSDDNKEPNAVFKNSPAVKNGRVYRINADIISRPGPRLVDAIEEIARILHPPE